MWGRGKKAQAEKAEAPTALKTAVREARIEAAERSGVVVDLRDAETVRLELLNEALDPLFKDIPDNVDLFDRGLSKGDVPRLWIDVIAHVEMGRDKRQYRFVQDTRYGRAVLAESYEVPEIVEAVTRYVARRMVERERALADDAAMGQASAQKILQQERKRRRWNAFRAFIYGLIAGIIALFVLAMFYRPHP
jgi:predicted nucleic acid-binding Zn ribbon protein